MEFELDMEELMWSAIQTKNMRRRMEFGLGMEALTWSAIGEDMEETGEIGGSGV